MITKCTTAASSASSLKSDEHEAHRTGARRHPAGLRIKPGDHGRAKTKIAGRNSVRAGPAGTPKTHRAAAMKTVESSAVFQPKQWAEKEARKTIENRT
jgi:hypothetical protein